MHFDIVFIIDLWHKTAVRIRIISTGLLYTHGSENNSNDDPNTHATHKPKAH